MGDEPVQALTLVFGTLFGTGLLGMLLRRWWKQQDDAFAADQSARSEERSDCAEAVTALTDRYEAEKADMRASFHRRHDAQRDAIRRIVALVPDDGSRTEAMEILLALALDDGEE